MDNNAIIKYFDLNEHPFMTSPDPRFLYLSSQVRKALAKCEFMARDRIGPIYMYGPIGTLRDGEETSEGRVERPIPLFSSQDIMLMDNEDVFAFHKNNRPMFLKRIDWRKNAILQARHGSEPGREAPPLKPLP